MYETHTRDLSKMPFHRVKNLFVALDKEGFPMFFDDDKVAIEYNMESDELYFVNENCDVAMINRETGKLESWFVLDSNQGFFDDLLPTYFTEMNEDDQERFQDIADQLGRSDDLYLKEVQDLY